MPEIAIFDATFVARNVHAGEYVNRDQRSNLLLHALTRRLLW
jgi:hypothetical protein